MSPTTIYHKLRFLHLFIWAKLFNMFLSVSSLSTQEKNFFFIVSYCQEKPNGT